MAYCRVCRDRSRARLFAKSRPQRQLMPGASRSTSRGRAFRGGYPYGYINWTRDVSQSMTPAFSQFKIWRLMYAMAAHEGWAAPDQATGYPGSASFRRNNPGNLRASPYIHTNDNGFCAFIDEFTGWAAFKYDLEQKAKGNTTTGLTGASTLRDLIFKWAPPTDGNDSEAYLQQVVQMSGLAETTKLSELAQ